MTALPPLPEKGFVVIASGGDYLPLNVVQPYFAKAFRSHASRLRTRRNKNTP